MHGASVLFVWALLHGGSWRGRRRSGSTESRLPCRVRLDAAGISVDGTLADLPAAVAACRAARRAEVTATGSAIVGVIADTLRALQAAAIEVSAPPELWRVAGLADAGERAS